MLFRNVKSLKKGENKLGIYYIIIINMLLLANDTLFYQTAQAQARITVLCSYSHSAFLYPEVLVHDCMNECTSISEQSKLKPLFNKQVKKITFPWHDVSHCAFICYLSNNDSISSKLASNLKSTSSTISSNSTCINEQNRIFI